MPTVPRRERPLLRCGCLLIRRWLEFGGIGVGDFICVEYTGGIEDGTVQGAYHISEGYLENGHVLILE